MHKFSVENLKKRQSDAKLKEEGVVHPIAVAGLDEPLQFKLRSLSSNAARMWEQRRYREQRHMYLNDQVPPIAVQDQNDIDKLAEVLVVDWNIQTATGEKEAVDVETVRAVMKELPDVRFDALQAANRKEAYRLQEVAAIEKNSEQPSSPGSAKAAEG